MGGYPNLTGRGDAGGYYIGGYPAVEAWVIPGPGMPRYLGYKGESTPSFREYPESLSPPPIPTAQAKIDLIVPADADVWFEGRKMTQTGVKRQFITPHLAGARSYAYTVRAQWLENGKTVERSKEVIVKAGERLFIDWTK